VLLALFLPAAPRTIAQAQSIPNEYRLKAAFLYQFPQFVEWPPEVWRGTTTVQLCILRPSPFGRELDALVRGESLNGRPYAVRDIATADEVAGCHLIFISSRAAGRNEVLKAASASPALTVGEGERFLDEGGIIALRVVERRVRFDVSATAAHKAGLRISSQLLGLALTVRGGPS
jgi:hypothetical protein